jgi:hypothetical protein
VKLHIWGNVFIPQHIAGMTERIEVGPFSGHTYLPSPLPLNGGFLTDNRSFRKETTASSRLRMRLVIDTETQRIRDWHQCGETIGIHRETGEELCRGREDTDKVRVEDVLFGIEETPIIKFRLIGSCSNPCITLAPSVDLDLNFEIRAIHQQFDDELLVSIAGFVEPFPAFEMYLRRSSDRITNTLFRLPVAPEATLLSMLGPANRPVDSVVTIPARKK